MQLHQLQPKTIGKSKKRVGRGGTRGKTSGRGTKGQKARAGHRIMPAIREELKKLPKRRGYRFKSIQDKPSVVNVSTLDKYFTAGDTVDVASLTERGLIRLPAGARGGSMSAKVLGDGEISKKLTVTGLRVSAAARTKIEKAGGTVQ